MQDLEQRGEAIYMLEQITSQEFSSLQETSLTLEVNGLPHTVHVAEVREFPAHAARPEPPFSVTLLCAARTVVAAGHLSSASSNTRRARPLHSAARTGCAWNALRDYF